MGDDGKIFALVGSFWRCAVQYYIVKNEKLPSQKLKR
jgi:hypothetical protein